MQPAPRLSPETLDAQWSVGPWVRDLTGDEIGIDRFVHSVHGDIVQQWPWIGRPGRGEREKLREQFGRYRRVVDGILIGLVGDVWFQKYTPDDVVKRPIRRRDVHALACERTIERTNLIFQARVEATFCEALEVALDQINQPGAYSRLVMLGDDLDRLGGDAFGFQWKCPKPISYTEGFSATAREFATARLLSNALIGTGLAGSTMSLIASDGLQSGLSPDQLLQRAVRSSLIDKQHASMGGNQAMALLGALVDREPGPYQGERKAEEYRISGPSDNDRLDLARGSTHEVSGADHDSNAAACPALYSRLADRRLEDSTPFFDEFWEFLANSYRAAGMFTAGVRDASHKEVAKILSHDFDSPFNSRWVNDQGRVRRHVPEALPNR